MNGKLNLFGVAAMYIGVIMGAGYASGRECWQFFGVFGRQGYAGALLAAACFIILALMLAYIARAKDSDDLGALISPFACERLNAVIGWVIAGIYYTIIIAMTAAGGSLLWQQFGISKHVGGIGIALFVLLTVLGDFDRISAVFRRLVPCLFIIGVATILITLFSDIEQSGATSGYDPGSMTPSWGISAIVFLSYNAIGMITMAGSSALRARDARTAYGGAALGTFLLGVLTILLLSALLRDMAFSAELDLPMLGYAARLNRPLSFAYAVVLYGSVYSTAASTYYGFSTKIPAGPHKSRILAAGVVLGYLLGLSGFQRIVEYLYPAQGYIGMGILLLIVLNFAREYSRKHRG